MYISVSVPLPGRKCIQKVHTNKVRYFPVPWNNLTPSPSAMEINCERPVLASTAMAFRSREIGILESGDGIGGSVIS